MRHLKRFAFMANRKVPQNARPLRNLRRSFNATTILEMVNTKKARTLPGLFNRIFKQVYPITAPSSRLMATIQERGKLLPPSGKWLLPFSPGC